MKCLLPACNQVAGAGLRGLCMKDYSAAKKKVEAGETTWDELQDLGLAKLPPDAFTLELERRREGKK